jgi:hypothetical protein
MFFRLTQLLSRFRPARSKPTIGRAAQLLVEGLESRELMSVTTPWFSGKTLVVPTDNASTSVDVRTSGTNIVISEVGTTRTWSYGSSLVDKVEFQGGAGNDRFVNNTSKLSVAFGNGGNDVLLGGSAKDQFVGGPGNDRLNGRGGADDLWGDGGDDVIITIDNGTSDYVGLDPGDGRDIIWVDKTGSFTDTISGGEGEDKCQLVSSFANGADKTLNGDRIADPTAQYISGTDAANNPIWSNGTHRRFQNNPLFASAGPVLTDIRQGAVGDCWLLAGMGAIANDNAHALRQNIVDFDDGTYGVRLGNSFYRVDDDLQVTSSFSATPVLAKLGAQNSMWVAITEKAYAYYRSGTNKYRDLNNGWSVEVNRAFQSTNAGAKNISSYASTTHLGNDIWDKWDRYQCVTIGFISNTTSAIIPGTPLRDDHQYVVVSVSYDGNGVITSITLYNPWGVDGGGDDGNDDGFIVVTPAQIAGLTGQVNWGAV